MLEPGIGFFNYGSSRGNAQDDRGLYEEWQKALAEIERLKTAGANTTLMPEWRPNPKTGEREYFVNNQWVRQGVWNDPEFQAMVVDPWTEQEKRRRADEHAKELALAQERAAMAQYDYDDFKRRNEELRGGTGAGSLGQSSYRSPRPGAMGQTTSRRGY
jgi:hypothetical protein